MTRNSKIAAGLIVAGIGFMAAGIADARAEVASWYGSELAGRPTASGDPFNPEGLTAAHKTLPLGSRVQVCLERCATVTINDRGPFTPGRDIDLSRAAAAAVGLEGVGQVELQAPGEAPAPAKPSETMAELPRTGGPGA